LGRRTVFTLCGKENETKKGNINLPIGGEVTAKWTSTGKKIHDVNKNSLFFKREFFILRLN